MSSCSEKCMGTKDVYSHGKKEIDIKNTPGYIQYADGLRKTSQT